MCITPSVIPFLNLSNYTLVQGGLTLSVPACGKDIALYIPNLILNIFSSYLAEQNLMIVVVKGT